jgi:hypothetical protein
VRYSASTSSSYVVCAIQQPRLGIAWLHAGWQNQRVLHVHHREYAAATNIRSMFCMVTCRLPPSPSAACVTAWFSALAPLKPWGLVPSSNQSSSHFSFLSVKSYLFDSRRKYSMLLHFICNCRFLSSHRFLCWVVVCCSVVATTVYVFTVSCC